MFSIIYETKISYYNCVKDIVNKDGITGLLFRGLGIRLFTNGIQGLMFNVMWKYLDSKDKQEDEKNNTKSNYPKIDKSPIKSNKSI